jgi:hypothetical protein
MEDRAEVLGGDLGVDAERERFADVRLETARRGRVEHRAGHLPAIAVGVRFERA